VLIAARGGESPISELPAPNCEQRGDPMRNVSGCLRITGLALVAALALGGIAVSSASAELPEFGKCVAQAEGAYTESNCATKAKIGQPHSFERVNAKEIVKSKFTGTGGTSFFETEAA
jgi:hypothetical protein